MQSSHQTTRSDYSYTYTSAAPVFAVPLGSDINSVTISGAAGKDIYLVKVNQNLNDAVAAASAGTVLASVSISTTNSNSRSLTPNTTQTRANTFVRKTKPEVEAFNNQARILRANTGHSRSLGGPSSASVVQYGPNPALTINTSTKNFWVQNSSNAWVSIPAHLRAIGKYCYVWIADNNFTSGSNQTTDDTLTAAQAQSLVDAFDGTPTEDEGIYKRDTTIFGLEYGGGSSGNGGMDADQHISILVYDIDGDYSASQSGGVFGFFWAKDEYTQSELSGSGLKSNQSEIFYLDAHLSNAFPLGALSTLAHEFQHMIHWNQKQSKGIYSSAWFNEMCSMIAEDLFVNVINPVNGQPDHFDIADQDTWFWTPYSRLQEFCWHYPESGVVDWLSSYDVLKSYASAYAFGSWLVRNYGGPALFSAMMQNSGLDGDAIVQAIASTGGGTFTFAQILEQYAQSLVYSTSPSGSSVKTHNTGNTWSFGSISYMVPAIDLSVVRQFDLDSSFYTGGFGPDIFSLNSWQSIGAGGMIVMQDPSWTHTNNTGSTVVIQCNKPSSSSVEYFVMVK